MLQLANSLSAVSDVMDSQTTTAASGPFKKQSSLFGNLDNMKKNMKESLTKPAYDVHTFYFTSGLAQRIARHAAFEKLTLSVITLNALWIAYDTDHNPSKELLKAPVRFQIAENFFCAYFFFEWFVRFFAFETKFNCLRDSWFVFDTALVLMMVMETWVMTILMAFMQSQGGSLGGTSILRIFRLLRLSRMARMLRSMPELMILVKGIMAAIRSVFFTLLLLTMVLYVFGIAFKQLSDDTNMGDKYFRTVGRSMYTLVTAGTFLDSLTLVSDAILAESTICIIFFYVFLLLSSCVLMNMLIGVLCQVVAAVSQVEKMRMSIDFVTSTLHDVLAETDKNKDLKICRDEFNDMLSSRKALMALKELDVDPVSLIDFADFIFQEDDGGDEPASLSLGDFLEVVMQLRGGNKTTVKDVLDLRKFLRTRFENIEKSISSRGDSQFRFKDALSSMDAPLPPIVRSPPSGSPKSAIGLIDLRVQLSRMEVTMSAIRDEIHVLCRRLKTRCSLPLQHSHCKHDQRQAGCTLERLLAPRNQPMDH